MKPNAAFARYRAVDLLMFGLMLAVFETVAVTAATRWFPGEPYTVSMTPLVTAIVMMRWGPWAARRSAGPPERRACTTPSTASAIC